MFVGISVGLLIELGVALLVLLALGATPAAAVVGLVMFVLAAMVLLYKNHGNAAAA